MSYQRVHISEAKFSIQRYSISYSNRKLQRILDHWQPQGKEVVLGDLVLQQNILQFLYPACYIHAGSCHTLWLEIALALLISTSIKIIKNEVGCRDDTMPKTVDARRHCEEE